MMDYDIKENLTKIRDDIRKAAEKTGRNLKDIELIAVSKTVGSDKIREAFAAGVRTFGENKVQEAVLKVRELDEPEINWNFIGHLQTNKINKVLPHFNLIQSVDSVNLAEEIDKRAAKLDKKVNVLLEVNTSRENSKFGFSPDSIEGRLERLLELKNINYQGLMTIAIYSDLENEVRICFQKLKNLFDKFKKYETNNFNMKYLSMGMSGDFMAAIEEGSNMVRIGSAIFGPRIY